MSNIFSTYGVSASYKMDGAAKIADVAIKDRASGTVSISRLPLLDISELSHTMRQQVDSTLSGDLFVLVSKGGTGRCSMTFLDRVSQCGGGSAASALSEYNKIRNAPGKYSIDVYIYDVDGATKLASFSGVVEGCVTQASMKEDTPLVYVTYKLIGIWNDK